MVDNNCVIEGTVKFRDGKKWKSRWCVMRKLSPVADDNMIEFTLINCKFSIEKTKQYLDMYYTVRDLMPGIYRNIHPCRPESESIFKTSYSTILPKLTQSMYRILWMKYKEGNINEMNMVKCSSSYSSNVQEIRLHEDLVMGDVHVFDFSNFKFALSLQVTPTMLKNWAFISQNVMSNRLKAVHFLNLPPYLDKLVSVFKSFASKKIGDRLYFHQNIESLTKHIPLELLPSDYGGKQESLEVLSDCLHLQLYRDSKDRYKQGQTKASLSLEHFLGLETGFTLDKESNTVAILCQDVVVVLAFDNRERLMQWQVKLSSHLNDGPHFLVLVSSAPPKSRLPPGPARLHVQERGFCLTTGVPPRVAGQWLISNLRRYGVVEGRFCFEGGSRCIKGEGLYVLLTDQGEEITTTLKAASVGNLHSSRRRPVSRNMSVMDSPRRGPLRALGGIGLELSESSLHSRADSPYTDMESNYGCGDSISNDGWGPPPIERCMSCISKLGAMSRSSTATITMGAPPCWEHTCDRHSISSSSDSSGWSQAVTKPPARPPKPGTSSPSPKKPAAPPPQQSYDNYDIPKIPFPVEIKADEHYDTPRKLKECMQGFGFDTVQKPCGCIVRIRQPEPERPCVCQRLMSCWSGTEDVHAIYATVDYSKKTHRQQPVATVANYANLAPMPTVTTTTASNYENMEFAQTLQLYENGKEIAEKARNLCTKCGHAQEDYLMMEPSNKPSQPHPGYIPMSPAVKQRLGKVLSNSNPNLGPALDRSIKPSGSSMLQGTIYQRKQLLDNVDNLDIKRRRSNSADSSTSRFEPEPEPETSPCHCTIAVRRSSSVPCKSNRDSSSSNDSGVFELPRKPQICANQTLPRRSKSSDPLRDLTFQFTKTETKSASAEAEVPVCPSGSTSSGTSDMSDYFETLSLSSHSSSDAPPPSCTLRPRSGNEYLSMQRLIAPVPEERH